MDFEITKNGVLKAYHGNGGDVVIPEGVKFMASEDVFDPKCKIKSLYLPQSFLGHYIEDLYALAFVWDHDENKVIDTYWNNGKDDYRLKGNEVYAYLIHFKMPYLNSYKVHPDNPVYTDRDGILYSKDMSYLLSMPFKNTSTVCIKDESFSINEDGIASFKRRIVKAQYNGQNLPSKCLWGAEELSKRQVLFYVPNAIDCEDYIKQKDEYESIDSLVVIAPKLNLEGANSYLCRHVALAYCYEPEHFDDLKAKQYREILAKHELDLYKHAKAKKLERVIEYFNSSFTQWHLKDKAITCEQEACRYLFDAILYGSCEDVQNTLKLDYDFWGADPRFGIRTKYNGAQMIAIACRYGGVDKLKALLDSTRFCTVKGSRQGTNINGFINESMFLWIAGYLHFYAERVKSSIVIADNNEVRGLEPLSEDERIKCIELLKERDILNPSKLTLLCFYALMCGDFKIANYLHNNGAKLDEFIRDMNNSSDRVLVFHGIIEKSLQEQTEGLVLFAKYAHDIGVQMRIPKEILLEFLEDRTELIYDLIDYVDITNPAMTALIDKCIVEGRTEPLSVFINHEKIKTKEALQKHIDKAIALEAREIVAILLEYQNTKYKSTTKVKRSSLNL